MRSSRMIRPVGGAKSLPDGDLLLPRCASKQEQIADVEARREQ